MGALKKKSTTPLDERIDTTISENLERAISGKKTKKKPTNRTEVFSTKISKDYKTKLKQLCVDKDIKLVELLEEMTDFYIENRK